MHHYVIIIFFMAIGIWIFGFLVGRNNPNISAVNKMIAGGKVIVAAGNKLVSIVKK